MIYNHFRSVFEIIKNSKNTIITDFKLGENSKSEPLRWTYEEIKRKENNGITFEDLYIKTILQIRAMRFS